MEIKEEGSSVHFDDDEDEKYVLPPTFDKTFENDIPLDYFFNA